MKKILDKIITGFFITTLGILWYFSTKYYSKPNQYNIIIYDTLGKEFKMEEIRTNFKIKKVALNFAREYKEIFPYYDFSVGEDIPEIKGRRIFSKITKVQR